MGNTSVKAETSSGHFQVGSQESFEIELNGVLWQCREFLSSIEHQTAAALRISDANKGQLHDLQDTVRSTENTMSRIVGEILSSQVTLTEQLKGLQSTCEGFKHMIQPLYNGVYPINIKVKGHEVLREKEDYITELNKERMSLKSKLEVMEKDITDQTQLQRQHEALRNNNNDLKEQIESIKRVSDRHRNDKEKAFRENESLQKSNKALKGDVNVLQEQLNAFERQNVLLEQQNTTNARQIEELRREMEIQRQRNMTVTVQLYSPRKGDLAAMVLREMAAMLETQFAAENMQLVASVCDKCSDIGPDKPVLTLCINASRLGSDVESALQRLTWNKHQGLIILHHKDTHALPNQPSERLLTSSSSQFKKLGGIFDMAFLSGKGIYPCDMNNRAVSELVNFIKTLSLPE